jgi:hypothetical protein
MTKGQILTINAKVNDRLDVGTKWMYIREMGTGVAMLNRLGKRGQPLDWVFNSKNVDYIPFTTIDSLIKQGIITIE